MAAKALQRRVLIAMRNGDASRRLVILGIERRQGSAACADNRLFSSDAGSCLEAFRRRGSAASARPFESDASRQLCRIIARLSAQTFPGSMRKGAFG